MAIYYPLNGIIMKIHINILNIEASMSTDVISSLDYINIWLYIAIKDNQEENS